MQTRPRDEGRHRSPFAAAFLSFLFPGLGQAYVGLYARGLAFAAPLVLVLALLAGLLVNPGSRLSLIAALSSPTTLLVVLGLDIVLLLYRVIAVVDAFRVAAAVRSFAEAGTTRLGRPRVRSHPLPIAGLVAVLLVTSLGHVAAARYDLIAYDLVTGISDGGGNEPTVAPSSADGAPTESTEASPGGEPTAVATGTPWTGTERLNILFIGADRRPTEATFNTDTLIVASIDPVTKQVAMLSLPRDTTGVPLPHAWRAASYYRGGVYPDKINSLWTRAKGLPSLFPGNDRQRGYLALKGALGELYQLDVQFYVEVDFDGFKKVVDTLGGLTIDVQMPVSDDHYPIEEGRAYNLYIAPGFRHMDGEQALAYARSRHKSSDFDRAQRQQRVIVSVRQQVDPASLLQPGRLEALVAALKQAVHTDVPPELFPQLITLARAVDASRIRSLVFTPPYYQVECLSCYSLTPKVDVIRRAVRNAFKTDRALEASRTKIGEEAAVVWVLNGSGKAGQAAATADYLGYLGIGAAVPTANGGRADRLTYAQTLVTVYNGAQARLPETIRVLEQTLGVTVALKVDPAVKADVIVITGAATPILAVPD